MLCNASRHFTVPVSFLTLWGIAVMPLGAATFEWSNTTPNFNGNWDRVTNWSLVSGTGTAPPGVGDTAQFNMAGESTVSFSSFSPSIWALDRMEVTDGMVRISGGSTSTSIDLATGDADLDVDGGHLTIAESSTFTPLTIDVSSVTFVRDGILELRFAGSRLNTLSANIGTTSGGTTGELLIDGGTFANTAAFTTFIGRNGSTGRLTILDGSATLIGETHLAVDNSAATAAFVDVSGTGTFTLEDLRMGGTVAGANASVTLSDDAVMTVTGSSTMDIGDTAGAGIVNIQDNALLDTGTGTITVNAVGDINLSGGTLQADGFLDFQGGRLDMTGGELIINNGMNARTNGVLNFAGGIIRVEGGLAELETSLNYGGPSAAERANLILRDGNDAQVQFGFRIGNGAGTFGRLEVDGVGSSLIGTNGGGGADLIVGSAGDGQLEVTEGGLLSFRDDFIIANSAGSNGTALVRGELGGTRSRVDVTIGGSGASVSIGQSSTGVLDIEDGGLVQAGGDVFLGAQATGNGTITVGDGPTCGAFPLPSCSAFDATLQAGDDLWLGGGSTAAGGAGVLNVNEGGLVIVPDLMRIYAGGTLNLADGEVQLGNLEVQSGTINFTGGELHFTGSAALGAGVISAIQGASGSHNAGEISAVGALTVNAPLAVDGVSSFEQRISASTLNVNAPMQHDGGRINVSTLNLSAIYTLEGGRLSINGGTNLDTNLNFVNGTLVVSGSPLTIGPGGLLGASLSVGPGRLLDNNSSTIIAGTLEITGGDYDTSFGTTIQSGGLLRVTGGEYSHVSGPMTVETGGMLEVTGGLIDRLFPLTIQTGATAANAGTLRPSGVTVDTGGSFTNTGIVDFTGGDMLAGSIDNQGSLVLSNSTMEVPASGLTLTGGGTLTADANATLTANSIGTVDNVDNLVRGDSSSRLTLRDMTLLMGPTANIGGAVDLENVDLVGGAIDTNLGGGAGTVFQGTSTLDGTVPIGGGVSVLGLHVLPTGELHLQSVSQLTVSATTLDLEGRLRAEAGAILHLATPGTYDWSGGMVSLADDSTHIVDPGAMLTLTTPLKFDNLNVGGNPNGIMRAVFGASTTITAGQTLEVAGTTTLNQFLVLDGGSFSTGFIQNTQNLQLRSGEFHLTADDFIVGPGGAGPVFTIGEATTVTIDEAIEIAAGNRLLVARGSVVSNGTSVLSLTNNGDLDVVDGTATFVGTSTNNSDINAVDSTLSFSGGLTNNGQLNLINSILNGSVNNGASVALAGLNTFTGDVFGSGNFTGSGTAVFQAQLAPGDSPAEVTFAGDVSLTASATLDIELGGLSPGTEFDQLDIAGDLSLDGRLIVSLLDGFSLATGMEFVIAEVDGSLSGMFTGLADGALVGNFGGTDLFIDYDAGDGNDIALRTAGLLGDFDQDGDVDGADFLEWQRTDGTPGGLTDWQNSYGTGASGSLAIASSATVPEPTTFLMVTMLGFVCAARPSLRRGHLHPIVDQ